MDNADYKKVRDNQPLPPIAERLRMDKHMKEQELKNLVKAFPTLDDCFNDMTTMKSLIQTVKKRTLKSDTTRVIQTVALVEIAKSLKELNIQFEQFLNKGNSIDDEQEEEIVEEDKQQVDKKPSRKLKSRK